LKAVLKAAMWDALWAVCLAALMVDEMAVMKAER
jgi:hypothetical protein